jgi:methyl-accepting chemotaxis protein
MKINTKIIMLIAASLILTSLVIGFLSVWQLRRTGQMSIVQIDKIGTENIERIKAEGEIREKSLRNELLSQKIDDIETLVENRKVELKNNIKTATYEMENKIQAIKTEIQSQVKQVFGLIALVTLIVLMVVLTASVIFTQQNITKPVKRIIEGLNEGAEQVVSASGQVALASQQLAEGASEQAASIEETSSSLEEMSSMVKQNADNTKEAARLVDISRQSMKTSHKFLKQTKDCMEKISSDGEKTSKLLKSIDEIAFQTNLLALNAAVEAARAGESGRCS